MLKRMAALFKRAAPLFTRLRFRPAAPFLATLAGLVGLPASPSSSISGATNRIPVVENGRFRLAPAQAWLSSDRWVGGLGSPREFVRGEPQMRLTVRIRKNDSRLHRYATWRAS
jgi:hypothetical protein